MVSDRKVRLFLITLYSRSRYNRRSANHAGFNHVGNHAYSRDALENGITAGQLITFLITLYSRGPNHVSHCPSRGQGTVGDSRKEGHRPPSQNHPVPEEESEAACAGITRISRVHSTAADGWSPYPALGRVAPPLEGILADQRPRGANCDTMCPDAANAALSMPA